MSQMLMGSLIAMKGIMRNEERFDDLTEIKLKELIETGRNIYQKSSKKSSFKLQPKQSKKISLEEKNDEHPIHNKYYDYGRAPRKRLKYGYEIRHNPIKNTKKKKQCSFCLSYDHNVTNCDDIRKWGLRISGDQVESFLQELCDPLSSKHNTEFRSDNDKEMIEVLDNIPKETYYLIVGRKFVINPLMFECFSERNLCVELTCLKDGGVPIEGYESCYMKLGKVRDWINIKRSRRHFFLLHKISSTQMCSTPQLNTNVMKTCMSYLTPVRKLHFPENLTKVNQHKSPSTLKEEKKETKHNKKSLTTPKRKPLKRTRKTTTKSPKTPRMKSTPKSPAKKKDIKVTRKVKEMKCSSSNNKGKKGKEKKPRKDTSNTPKKKKRRIVTSSGGKKSKRTRPKDGLRKKS